MVKSAEDDGILTTAVKFVLKSSLEENEKENRRKTDALYSALFRKKMAIKSQKKKYTKGDRKLLESTGFIATSKR